MVNKSESFAIAAAKAGMSEKTARKYYNSGKYPTEMKKERTWRTRKDSFTEHWDFIVDLLKNNSGLEVKFIFDYLQRENPGKYQDGQLRTLQRKIKCWKATEGPSKEVMFPQIHYPGILCESDYTRMNDFNITIQGQPFEHMLYHFVLTYSNWEIGKICYSESFESLAEGLDHALHYLGGVPEFHRTDRLSAAVNNLDSEKAFTERYQRLLKHYKLKGQKIQTGKGNENGDVEQRHYRLKNAIRQTLILRGSNDFICIEDYQAFLEKLFIQLNSGRTKRLSEEMEKLRPLPANQFGGFQRETVKVGPSSTIRTGKRTYSINSRLIGEWVETRLYSDKVEVWYGQRKVETMQRLFKKKHDINYRHIIDSLIRKPGAFKNYRYREDLFPTSRFRMAYDLLDKQRPEKASKEYLKILNMAAKKSEDLVDRALQALLDEKSMITSDDVEQWMNASEKGNSDIWSTEIKPVDMSAYDELINLEAAS